MSGTYSTGTVTVTNGSATVTGSGTAWVGVVRAGWLIKLPDGQHYTVATVDSATQITLADNYQGSNASGAAYRAVPTGGVSLDLQSSIDTLISDYQDVADNAGTGKFADGTNAEPSLRGETDQDTGWNFPGVSNTLDGVLGGTRYLRMNSSAFDLDLPVTGDAVQAAVDDATSGRLIRTGTVGILGGNGAVLTSSDDLDAETEMGFYSFSSGDEPANAPFSGAGVVLVQRRSSTAVLQTAQRISSTATALDQYHRAIVGGTPNAWQKVFTEADVAGAISDALNGADAVTRGEGTFLPTLGLVTTGTSSFTYGTTQAGWWQRLDNIVQMGVEFDEVTISKGSGSGRLELDFSDSGLTASAVAGALGRLDMIEWERFLDLPPTAFDLRWVAVPGTQKFQLAFNVPKTIEQMTAYSLGTDVEEGETITGTTSSETAKVLDVLNVGNLAGTADPDQYLWVTDRSGDFTALEDFTGNHGGAGKLGGTVTTIATAGTNWVEASHLIDGAWVIKAAGRIII